MRTARRTILQLGVGGFAGALLPAPAEAASPFSFAPNWSTNWVLHRDPGLGASVTQLANGIILKAAPYAYDNAAVYARSSVALWNKTRWSGDFRVEFDFTRLDDVTRTTGNGIGAMLYFHVLAQGDAAHPESIAQWPSKAAREEAYIRHSRGLRVSWSNFNTQSPQNTNQIRLRTFGFTTKYPVQVGPDSPAKFPFPRNQKYHMVFERRGQTFKVAVGNQTFSWNDPAIGQYGDGYFGLRHQPGREAKYENFSISRP